MPSARPVDSLAPGELLEGTEKVFGLVLPRAVRVESVFIDVAYVSTPYTTKELEGYLRTRVRDGVETQRPDLVTLFEKVHIPASPDRLFQMRIAPATVGGTMLEVRDVTPKPTPPAANDEERWRAVGLTPKGRLIDPTKLE